MPEWTDERVKEAQRLWSEGVSASQIAVQLGSGLTRNAVIGKMSRLGQQRGRAREPVSDRPARPKAERKVMIRPPVARVERPTFVELPEPLPVNGGLTIMQLTERTCKWPLGDPRLPTFRYCGCQVEEGKRYCSYHHQKGIVPLVEYRKGERK